MKKFLIVLGIAFVLLCVFYHFLLLKFFPQHHSLEVMGIISFLMLIPAAIIYGVFSGKKEISLLRKSDNPNLKDGHRVALTGYVRSLHDELRSPFTQKPCVSYYYRVSRTVSSGKNRHQAVEYSGNVQVPSTLRTNVMEVRLLGLLEGEVETFDESNNEIVKQAYEYLSNRQFKPKEKSLSKAISNVKELLTDNDGSILEEFKITDQPLDLSGRQLEEWCLETNKPYSIIGVWSAAQSGLISDPFGKGNISALKGDATEAAKSIRGKIGCSIIAAIVLIAIINFIAYLALEN